MRKRQFFKKSGLRALALLLAMGLTSSAQMPLWALAAEMGENGFGGGAAITNYSVADDTQTMDVAAKDVTGWVENQKLTVRQANATIAAGGTLNDQDDVTAAASFDVPVFSKDEDGNELQMQPGDYLDLPICTGLTRYGETEVTLEVGNTPIGSVAFSEQNGAVTARVTFGNDAQTAENLLALIDDGTDKISCKLSLSLSYEAGADDSGIASKPVTIYGESFTVAITQPIKEYTLTKSGTPDLAQRRIVWTMTAEGKLGTQAASLAGCTLTDDLSAVGEFVPGSFAVGADAGTMQPATPTTDANGVLSYTFTAGAGSKMLLTFETRIRDQNYYATGQQAIQNSATLTGGETPVTAKTTVRFTPKWIEKTGTARGEGGPSGGYKPANRTISWTITANHFGATLQNAVITDVLPAGLTFESASWQTGTIDTDGAITWNSQNTTITPTDNDSKYHFGDLSTPIRLTIVTGVPDQSEVVGTTSYQNRATITWESGPGNGLTTNPYTVTLGYDALTKKSTGFTPATAEIQWEVTVNARQQAISNMAVYDLVFYGKDKLAPADLHLRGNQPLPALTQNDAQCNQQLVRTSVSSSDGLEATVQDVYNVNGDTVGQLLKITGAAGGPIPTNGPRSIRYHTQITNPQIFANNNVNTKLWNTAVLMSGENPLSRSVATCDYTGKMLNKDALKAEKGQAIDEATKTGTVTAGLVNQEDGAAANDFNYQDKDVVFRIHVNANDMDMTEMGKSIGRAAGDILLTDDQLPEGWVFKQFDGGQDYLLFAGTGSPVSGKVEATGAPLAISGSSELREVSVSASKQETVFTFRTLTQPYVVLVKAGPNEETTKDYFSRNTGNQAIKVTNAVKLSVAWSEPVQIMAKARLARQASETTLLATAAQDVIIKSELLTKRQEKVSSGLLRWSVDFNPYGIAREGISMRDTLPLGVDLRTDSMGQLLLTAADGAANIALYPLALQPNGTTVAGQPLTAQETAQYLSYDSARRVLSFTTPDPATGYRLTYLTDLTGEVGMVSNQVSLAGAQEVQASQSASYSIQTQDAEATASRAGWIGIQKRGADNQPLKDAEFTVFASDRQTVIRRGVTQASELKLRGLPDGDYYLQETRAPAGYTLDPTLHTVKVRSAKAAIDGQTGADAHRITLVNYKTDQTGDLTIAKTVGGDAGERDRAFQFALELFGDEVRAEGYAYLVDGAPQSGKLRSGDQFTLMDGQILTVLHLPQGAKYAVTEADYTTDGYETTADAASGEIAAGTTAACAFTNVKNLPPNPDEGDKPGDGGETPDEGDKPGDSGETPDEGDKPGDGGETPDEGDKPGDGGETPDEGDKPGDGGSSGGSSNTGSPAPSNPAPVVPAAPIEPEIPAAPTEPQAPAAPDTEETPTDPAATYLSRGQVPSASAADSPAQFVLIGEDGTPLGTYTKVALTDGTFVYIDENGVPLARATVSAANTAPRTGDDAPLALWLLLLCASAAGLVMSGRRARDEARR